jgi:hypothetical protein
MIHTGGYIPVTSLVVQIMGFSFVRQVNTKSQSIISMISTSPDHFDFKKILQQTGAFVNNHLSAIDENSTCRGLPA